MNYGGPFSKIFAPPPEGCAKWSGVCESTAVYNTIDGSKCPMSPLTSSFLTHATPSCPEDRAIRKGPRPFGTAPPYIPFNQPLPEGCADWSGVCKDSNVYNTIDGSKCPMSESTKRSMTHTTYMCPEWKTSTLDRFKKMPTWVWVAVGAGAALFLTRRRR